jgi:hypothetical protein
MCASTGASTTGTAVSDAARIVLTASMTLVRLATASTASLAAPSSRTVRERTPPSSAPCARRNLTTSIWVTILYTAADSTSSTATTFSAELSSGTSARCTPLLNVSMQSSTLQSTAAMSMRVGFMI